MWRDHQYSIAMLVLACFLLVPVITVQAGEKFSLRGFNFIQTEQVKLNHLQTILSLKRLKRTGADTVALVPFLWQARTGARQIIKGNAVQDDELIAGIQSAHALGLKVIIKPHVWVTGAWAGEVAPERGAAWNEWFEHYRFIILQYARLAQKEGVEYFIIGTELRHANLSKRSWSQLISSVRYVYKGHITYAAHGIEQANKFCCWQALDSIAATVYPVLSNNTEPVDMHKVEDVIRKTLNALKRIGVEYNKPVWLAEVGQRSARDSLSRPWESPEQRLAAVDLELQSQVNGMWAQAAAGLGIDGLLFWNWYSDPDAGGDDDTDFTVQNKPAERRLTCLWANRCVDII